jgi:LuxR family transcriptional regulator
MRINIESPGATNTTRLEEALPGCLPAHRALGFDAVIYDYTPVPRSLEGTDHAVTAEMRNVPDDMRRLWCERGYYQVDPVQHFALESCAPFVWSYQRPDRSALQGGWMRTRRK